MFWTSALVAHRDFTRAFDEAVDEVIQKLPSPPNLVVAFVAHEYGEELLHLPEMVANSFPDCTFIGCSAPGIIGNGRELEGGRAISLLAGVLPNVEISSHYFAADDTRAVEEIVGIKSEQSPQFLLFAEPSTLDAESLLRELDRAYPSACKLGGLVSGLVSGESDQRAGYLFTGDHARRTGAVAVSLRGNVAMDSVVAQGCKPIGEPLIVTRSEGNSILEFNRGRPIDVLRDAHRDLDSHDRSLLEHSLFLGIEMKSRSGIYEQGDFLIRHIVGFDPDTGAMTVASPISDYQVVQFHLRDRITSSEDLHERLDLYRDENETAPAATLLFSCLGRGEHLYGRPDHDSQAFLDRFGETPLSGFFCSGEIGPVGGRSFLHGYTSAFGMIRPKQRSL